MMAKGFAAHKIPKCWENGCSKSSWVYSSSLSTYRTVVLICASFENKNKSQNLLVPESRDKGAILAAVLVFPGKHGQCQVTPLVRSQTLHRHQNPVTLAAVVAPRPGFIFQGCSRFSFCKFHNARVFGSLTTLQSCVWRIFSFLLKNTYPPKAINSLSLLPFRLSHVFILIPRFPTTLFF